MTGLPLLAALSTAMCAALVARAVVRPLPRLASRVRPYVLTERVALGLTPTSVPDSFVTSHALTRLFAPILLSVLRTCGSLFERRSDTVLALRLLQAGSTASPQEYRMRQVVTAGGFGIGAFALSSVVAGPVVALGVGVVAFVGGAARVRAQLDQRIAARDEEIRLQLATINQVLALHVRAGAGPVQALQRLCVRGHGAFVDECRAVLRSLRTGTPEADAFRRAADTASEPIAARTFAMFAAAVERGADLSNALLDLANDIRDSRRDEIRAAATKRRAAMLIPTIAILAPIMLLFIAAPIPSMIFGAH